MPDVARRSRSFVPLVLALMLTAFTLAGCIDIGLDVPLGPEVDGVVDPEILGRWKCVSTGKDDGVGALVLAPKGEHVYAISSIDSDGKREEFLGHTTPVGTTTVMNFRPVPGAGEEPAEDWLYLRFVRHSRDILQVEFVSDEALEDVPEASDLLRDALAEKLDQPGTFTSVMACLKVESGADDTAPSPSATPTPMKIE